ncbi:MAG: hypothetical protein J3R72DRAFT_500066 [Linnemannia gamsii]|nr:MAG: hypothetical protein J3R72DRAFT_500066 [Linnemannia gamsii]
MELEHPWFIIPAVGAPSRWFETRRGLALGLAMSGVGVGVGVVHNVRIPGSVVTSSNKIEDDLESIDVVLESRSTNSIDTALALAWHWIHLEIKVSKIHSFSRWTIAQLVSSFGLTPQNGALIAGLSSGAVMVWKNYSWFSS